MIGAIGAMIAMQASVQAMQATGQVAADHRRQREHEHEQEAAWRYIRARPKTKARLQREADVFHARRRAEIDAQFHGRGR